MMTIDTMIEIEGQKYSIRVKGDGHFHVCRCGGYDVRLRVLGVNVPKKEIERSLKERSEGVATISTGKVQLEIASIIPFAQA